MNRREMLLGALAFSFLADPAHAGIKRRKRLKRLRRQERRNRTQRNRNQSYTLHRVPGGYWTPAILTIGMILILDNGDECRVIRHDLNGGSVCQDM